MFAAQVNPETLELYDADAAFHPFIYAAKLQSEDFPTFNEILKMPPEERLLWMRSIDEEFEALIEREAIELVP